MRIAGRLPMTDPWARVVRPIAEGADVATVADATLRAAQKALGTVTEDPGFREAMYVMVRLAEAGLSDDAAAYLEGGGIEVGDGSLPCLLSGISEALDEAMDGKGNRSDWGEMASTALVSSVSDILSRNGLPLFGAKREDLTPMLKGLHTEKNFGEFGRSYFATLTGKFLNYFLSQSLGSEIGEGHRFTTTKQVADFKQGLKRHCNEAAVIVQKFCGQWFAKHWKDEQGNISRKSAADFGWNAVRKIRWELNLRDEGDGD